MKKLLFAIWVALITISIEAQQKEALYSQLCELNAQWLNENQDQPILKKKSPLASETELIQLHIKLVEENLTKRTIQNLSPSQLANRRKALDLLKNYGERGLFPTNTQLPFRNPVFVDELNTACAVGYMIQQTGFPAITEKVRQNMNFGYVKELVNVFPELLEWASTYGFTADELAWIQPGYGGGLCNFSALGSVYNPSCPGSCDGTVILAEPVGFIPPYFITGSPCYGLCAGSYTWTVTDSVGNSMVVNAVLTDPVLYVTPSIVITPSFPGACDGVVTAEAFSTNGAYIVDWYEASTMTMVGSGDTLANLCAGTYLAVLSDVNGCVGDSVSVMLDVTTEVKEVYSVQFSVFPNPAADILFIDYQSTQPITIKIIDLAGKQALKTKISANNNVDIGSLKSGTYIIQLISNGLIVGAKKLVVK